MVKKQINKVKNFLVGLFYGVRATETEVFTQAGSSSNSDVIIDKEVGTNSLAEALLKGEVTQEVKELRYQTYAVERESSNYEYLANGVVVKKNPNEECRLSLDKTYDYQLQLVQENKIQTNSVFQELSRVDTYGGERKYTIHIERTQIPRYRLEEYTQKLVVKRIDVEHVFLEFYCSKYPDKFNQIMTQGFLTEVKNVKEDKKPTEIFTFDKVWFISEHAYGSKDYYRFEYGNLIFKDILEFDGDYVICFEADVISDGFDLTEKYFDAKMDSRYKNKEKRTNTLDLTPPKNYKCKECGNDINPYDARIIEQTYGEMVCLECLEKKAEEYQKKKYQTKKK